MTKLIVHMGLHRTATTTLQTSLRALKPSLQNTTVVLREDMENNTCLDMRKWHRSGLSVLLRPRRQKAVKKFARAINALNVSKVIVSEENLIGTMPGVTHYAGYPQFSSFAATLHRLDSFVKVYPRLVVRRQDDFIESVYAFRVARGLTDDFSTFLARFKPLVFDWNRLADSLLDFGDRTQIAVLEEWRETGSVAENALAFVGVYADGMGKGRGNRRLGNESTALMLALNKVGAMPNVSERKKLLFPLLAEREKDNSDSVIDFLKELPITAQQRLDALSHMKAKASVAFTSSERQAFMLPYTEINARFLARPEVLVSTNIWH